MPIYIRDSGSWKNVSDSATITFFETGTRLLFIQDAAPVGWVKETNTTFNNAALRIVAGNSTTGGGVVDGSGFTSVFASRLVPLPYHQHGGTTFSENANHVHGIGDSGEHFHGPSTEAGFDNDGNGQSLRALYQDGPPFQNIVWSLYGGNHNHGGATGGISNNQQHQHQFATDFQGTNGASMNFAVRYIDAIICTKQ